MQCQVCSNVIAGEIRSRAIRKSKGPAGALPRGAQKGCLLAVVPIAVRLSQPKTLSAFAEAWQRHL